jgi:DNA-binding GntR family transcriptional regulator
VSINRIVPSFVEIVNHFRITLYIWASCWHFTCLTLANKAYDCIRADIIPGILPPETPLRLAELKEPYGMGSSPLREAPNRLHSERYVDVSNLKGFRVAPWSLPEMHDAMQTRSEI